jgi:hypothetical protein
LTCQGIETLEKATDGGALSLTLQSEEQVKTFIHLLKKASPGNTKIIVKVKTTDSFAMLSLASSYTLTPDLRASMASILPPESGEMRRALG